MEWRIYPLDPLFFRGTRPMNAGEGGFHTGRFPPSPQVMQGFVRSALIEAAGVSYTDYAAAVAGSGSDAARELIGLLGGPDTEGIGRIELRGPYLVRENGSGVERLFPAPLDLAGRGRRWLSRSPGPAVESDLGSVRFVVEQDPPEADDPTAAVAGAPSSGDALAHDAMLAGRNLRPGEAFITESGLREYLAGRPLSAEHLVVQSKQDPKLYTTETRTGIARDSKSGIALDGHLYSTVSVRLAERSGAHYERIGIGLRVEGVDPELQRRCAGVSKLGGEGRLVEVEIDVDPPAISDAPPSGSSRIRLLLLTPARWGGSWLPGVDAAPTSDGWPADFDGARVVIVSAVTGKPEWIGGWDIVNRRPRPAEACVPAGSVFFLETQDPDTVIARLHDSKTGSGAALGFGHTVVGTWTDGTVGKSLGKGPHDG